MHQVIDSNTILEAMKLVHDRFPIAPLRKAGFKGTHAIHMDEQSRLCMGIWYLNQKSGEVEILDVTFDEDGEKIDLELMDEIDSFIEARNRD